MWVVGKRIGQNMGGQFQVGRAGRAEAENGEASRVDGGRNGKWGGTSQQEGLASGSRIRNGADRIPDSRVGAVSRGGPKVKGRASGGVVGVVPEKERIGLSGQIMRRARFVSEWVVGVVSARTDHGAEAVSRTGQDRGRAVPARRNGQSMWVDNGWL